ncbi:MAG: hypothetical protein Q7K98_08115 [Candidatus Omnitrophota bacterium]|nr:hypothetical protein [Candidatus Omnitrophota bacterium]
MKRFLWVFLGGLIFLAALSSFILFEYRLHDTFSRIRERLILIASNAAISIDADEILKIPLVQRSEGIPEYMAVYRKLVKVKESNPSVKYAYIMTTTDQPGILQYVVDADPVPEIITAHCPTALPGDKYDARNLPEMLEAYSGPTADRKITTDVWGVFISGYAPIRDASGKAVAILGVDTEAGFVRNMRKDAKLAARIALLAGLLFLASPLSLIKFSGREGVN